MGSLILTFTAIFGSMVGSFINVCIVRLPKNESLVLPASHCPQCKKNIPWYDNIPIFSWIMLRGHCRFCHQKISIEYPIVEAITALIALLFIYKGGLKWDTFIYFCFSSVLVVIAFIDLHHRIIPNIISLPGILIGIILSFFLPNINPLDSILGILIGGGSLYFIAEIYRILRKIEGMGMGDVKLLAMIGAFMGWEPLLYIILISSFSGAIIGILFISIKGKNWQYQIPFGTFLAFATIIQILFGLEIMSGWHSLLAKIIL